MTFPNVLLIVMDAARADHLSCYGYSRSTTPNIDKIAGEGILYEAAISPAVWTVPSHASLFTGMYPSGHGLRGRNLKLRDDITTLAEFLSGQGYETVCLTANALVGPATGLSRGFGEFKELRKIIQGEHLDWWQQKVNGLYRRLYYGFKRKNGAWYDDGAWRLNFEMKRWLRGWLSGPDTRRPFFIFANYLEPHLRYRPPRTHRYMFLTPDQRKRWKDVNQNAWKYMSGAVHMTEDDWEILIALYDAELAYLDMRLGQIYEFLRENGVLDDTILIITSDHGENLGEHNLMDHQYCVYDTLIRVPLIIRYPHRFCPQGRICVPVQTLDIFPTLVDLLVDSEIPFDPPLQGQSMLPEKLERSSRTFTVTEYLAPQLHSFKREAVDFDDYFARQLRAIRTKQHKFIWASDGSHELYDLSRDPDENHNLIDSDRVTAESLEQELQRWLRDFWREQNEDSLIDEAVISRLEALGYI